MHGRPGGAAERWAKLTGSYGRGVRRQETPDEVMARVFPELTWPEIQAQVQAHRDLQRRSPVSRTWVLRSQRRPAPGPVRAAPADRDYVKGLCLDLLSSR